MKSPSTNKKKESKVFSSNGKVRVAGLRPMTEQEERRFIAAIDALLAHWAQRHLEDNNNISRKTEGEDHVQQNEHQGHAHGCAAS